MRIWKEGKFIMMVKPTVAELLEKVDNRYTLVLATAKRARQISSGDTPLVKTEDVAAVSIAADEIDEGKVEVC
jgi:DNA-directed RNA polymerase subunit omega